MQTYIDENYMVVGHTLLGYTGDEEALIIPEEIDGSTIRKIGSGALGMNSKIEAIVFPDSVSGLGDEILNGTRNIKYIEIPLSMNEISITTFLGLECDRICFRLPESKLSYMKKSMPLAGMNERLLNPDTLGICKRLINAMFFASGYNASRAAVRDGAFVDYEIREDMNWLFRDDVSETPRRVQWESESSYSGDGLQKISELDAAYKLINENLKVYENEESEKKSDWRKKTNGALSFSAVALLRTAVGKSVYGDSPVLIVRPDFGFYFFPSVKKIVCDHEYWIYRRCYLVQGGYVPCDVAVLERNGVVKDADIKRKVYAKYRLLTTL